jgi:hypothetical protein
MVKKFHASKITLHRADWAIPLICTASQTVGNSIGLKSRLGHVHGQFCDFVASLLQLRSYWLKSIDVRLDSRS